MALLAGTEKTILTPTDEISDLPGAVLLSRVPTGIIIEKVKEMVAIHGFRHDYTPPSAPLRYQIRSCRLRTAHHLLTTTLLVDEQNHKQADPEHYQQGNHRLPLTAAKIADQTEQQW